MAQLLEDEYVAGFFRRSVPLALMWSASNEAATRPEGAYRAPTWSWASMDDPIDPLYTQPRTIQLSTIEHLEIQLIDPCNQFGQIKFVLISLRGPALSISWKNIDTGRLGPKYGFGTLVEENMGFVYSLILMPVEIAGVGDHKSEITKSESITIYHQRMRAIRL